MAETLTGLLARPEFRKSRDYQVFTLWPSVVGKELARRCWPVRLRHGVLYVECSDHVWASELLFLKARILSLLGGAFDLAGIREIRVSVGTMEQRTPTAERPPMRRSIFPDPGEPPDLSSIPDAELRDWLGRLWAHQREVSQA